MNQHVNRDSREVVAYHEAGHAVMAMSFGFPVYSITIVPQDGFNGLVSWGAPPLNDKDTIRKVVFVKMAGLGADYSHRQESDIFDKNDNEIIRGLQSDIKSSEDLLANIGERGFAKFYGTMAASLLSEPQRWEIVKLIANILLETKAIDGQDFIKQISDKCPKLNEDQFQLKSAVIDKLKEQENLSA
ncbi:hypothetical protein [Brucella sp. NBRC 12950]|uniref:hypothetical protein n=1 Tax=Brucella sp. NBRC 12950 TaxID=2994518 RepID=UPI0024A5B932|nr:hypothetical protein [Brucella sp. NBRC 12950]GLU25547.1 hypothetical protein Brsp01_07800 [Brucella sp. NBRC 12950]